IAAHGGGGHTRVRFAEGAQPGLGEAPQRRCIVLVGSAHGGPAAVTGGEVQPGGGPLLAVTEIGNEGSGRRQTDHEGPSCWYVLRPQVVAQSPTCRARELPCPWFRPRLSLLEACARRAAC